MMKSVAPLLDFKQIADSVPAMIGVYNIHTGEYLYVNKAVKKILGYTPEVFTKKGLVYVSTLVHPDDVSSLAKENTQALIAANKTGHALDQDSIVNFEYRMKHKDGTWRWLHTDGSVFSRNEKGKVECVLNVSIDITQRRTIEEKLLAVRQEQLQYQATLTKNIADAIVVTDLSYKVTGWNEAAEKLYGWKAVEVMGKVADNYVKTTFLTEKDEKEWPQALREKGYWKGEVVQQARDGKKLAILASVAIITNSEGAAIGAVAVNRDITERKRLEQQKDEFLAVASHELKTPVTSLKAYAQVLHKWHLRDGNTEYAHHLGKMDEQLDKLTQLISDLLDVTKIQAGKLQFEKTKFDISALIRETVEQMQRTTEKHSITMQLTPTRKLWGNRDRVEQILINLLSNAIKYSPKADKILVTSRVENGEVVVSVQDFGVGIPKELHDKVFDRFFRGDGTDRKNTYPGLGLGLYISSEIMKRLNGKLWVQSTGKGSTFSFSLPLVKSREKAK